MKKKFIVILLAASFGMFYFTAVYGYDGDSMSYMYIPEDYKLYSNATLDDYFNDSRVIVVLTLRASRNLREWSVSDFPEANFVSIRCLTPGLTSATRQINADENYVFGPHSIDLMNFRRVFVLELRQSGHERVLNAAKLIERRSDVRSANPDFYLQSASNDETLDSSFDSMWWKANINLSAAQKLTKGSPDIVVGVIDTGVYKDHPAFGGRVCTILSGKFTTDSGTEFDDIDNHGTPVAGIIAGVDGIAPNVKIASLYTGIHTHSESSICAAIQHATNHPEIIILNISIRSWKTGALLDVIRAFPGLVVGSAGNGGYDNNIYFPDSSILGWRRPPNLIIVGAMTDQNERWFNSCWGNQTVDLFAPGYGVGTIGSKGVTNYPFGGTSAAAPIVSGVAALIASIDPNIRGDSLRNVIITHVNRVVGSSIDINYSITGGRINALDSVTNTPVTILPNQWGFWAQYFFYSNTESHTFRDLNVITNRLRTGFIENEVVVLSSKRTGAGLAYIEFHFSRPIRRIDIDLGLWSGNEDLGINVSELKIEYLDLFNGWQPRLNLHQDVNLGHRVHPTRLLLDFTDDVLAFRIINIHHNPSGTQNRGRLCIGSMTVHTRRDW